MEELLEEGLIGWLFVLAVIVSGFVGLHYYLTRRRYYQQARKIPEPPGLPIIGHALNFLNGSEEAFRNVWNTMSNNEVCKLWFGTSLYVFIRNPADIELVLSSREHLHKANKSTFMKPCLGGGINLVSGCKWKAYRQLTAPMFQYSQFLQPILNYNSILENKLLQHVGKDVDCYNYLSDVVMEVLLESIFGGNNDKEESKNYSEAIQKISKIIRYRQTALWLYTDIIFNLTKHAKHQNELIKTVHRFTRQVVKNRKEELMKHGYGLPKNGNIFEDLNLKIQNNNNNTEYLKKDNRRVGLLDLMMEMSPSGVILLDSEIQSQLNAIMLEGHNTTALTSSYFLCVMADRPDIQEKCVAELNEIFGESHRPVTLEDTFQMKYLERCLMETLRIYPPIPFIARELNKELRLASIGLTIPANSTVVIDVQKLHRDEGIYPNPDVFDPDNFLLENCVSRHYYSYIPFSAGPRSCIGRKYSMLSLKVLLASVLRNYKILPPMDQENVSTKSRDLRTCGFVVRLEHRRK